MNGKQTLYLDQYGNPFWARTVQALREQIANGGSTVHKQYADKRNGSTIHNGYVIGPLWLTAYAPIEKPA